MKSSRKFTALCWGVIWSILKSHSFREAQQGKFTVQSNQSHIFLLNLCTCGHKKKKYSRVSVALQNMHRSSCQILMCKYLLLGRMWCNRQNCNACNFVSLADQKVSIYSISQCSFHCSPSNGNTVSHLVWEEIVGSLRRMIALHTGFADAFSTSISDPSPAFIYMACIPGWGQLDIVGPIPPVCHWCCWSDLEDLQERHCTPNSSLN